LKTSGFNILSFI
jgi:hypothetical protein